MRNRSIRNKGRRGQKEAVVMDITSLIDILVTLLFFLITAYNTSEIVFNIPQGVTIPSATSTTIPENAVNVQVSTQNIWVDDLLVFDFGADTTNQPNKENMIVPLYDELVNKKNLIKEASAISPEATKFTGQVNMIVDRALKYSQLKQIMKTVAEAGYSKFKFIILSQENAPPKESPDAQAQTDTSTL